MSNRLLRNTLTLLVNNGGSAVLSFVLSVLIGRSLGEAGLGVYATALAWVFPFSILAEFGLGTLITRDVAANPALADDYVHGTARFRLLLGGGLTLLLILAAPLLSADPITMHGIQLSAPLILIVPTFGAFTAVFRAQRRMAPIAWLNLGMLGGQIMLTILVLLLGGGIIGALAVNVATSAGQLVAAYSIYKKSNRQVAKSAENNSNDFLALSVSWRFNDWVRRALPFAVAGVLAALQLRIGVVLLERIAGTGEAGYYAAANRFIEAARMIPNALFGALLPALAALVVAPEQLNRTFTRVMLGLAGFGVLVGLLLLPLALPLIDLTYGAAFIPAVSVLQIAAWALIPGLLRNGLTLYAYAHQREHTANVMTGLALILQVGLFLWLIPVHGAAGLVLAGGITESVILVIFGLVMLLLGKRLKRKA